MSRDRALEHFLSVAPAELGRVAERLDRAALERAVEVILAAEEKGARVHVTGIGKAEQVARYAAGLLSSTGTPATFLDGTGAVHGGVGQLRPEDVLVAISNSGETSELLRCGEGARAPAPAPAVAPAAGDTHRWRRKTYPAPPQGCRFCLSTPRGGGCGPEKLLTSSAFAGRPEK